MLPHCCLLLGDWLAFAGHQQHPNQTLGAFYVKHSESLGGRRLVGRAVCVEWGRHNSDAAAVGGSWYPGKILAYHEHSGEFTVRRWAATTAAARGDKHITSNWGSKLCIGEGWLSVAAHHDAFRLP
jgi:hypothetical protein